MPLGVTDQIALRVRQLRSDRGLTLGGLADRAGVSRSTISLIERGETSPTAVVLERLAGGLGVALASLFEPAGGAGEPVSRRSKQAEWTDPDSGYRRRNVSPRWGGTPIQIVEVAFPAGAQVAYESAGRDRDGVHQQIWILKGALVVTVGAVRHELAQGDCLAMVLDEPIAFSNPTRSVTRYAVVLVDQTGAR